MRQQAAVITAVLWTIVAMIVVGVVGELIGAPWLLLIVPVVAFFAIRDHLSKPWNR
ncbi:MAG: hypothetical protein R3C16_09295 [Hyphomonadaceae bacterium]